MSLFMSFINWPYKQICVSLFFLIFLGIGISIHKDYSVSWDEPAQRLIGGVNLTHIAKLVGSNSILSNPQFTDFSKIPLDQLKDRDYGVIFEVPAIFIEHLLGLSDSLEIYHSRHLLTFLFVFCGLIAVYRMGERRFSNWRAGLLVASFFILSPRFFAESFYNDKDLVFVSVFAIAMNTAISFLITPNTRTLIFHSIASAIAIDARIMAVIIPAVTLFIFTLELIRQEIPWRRSVFLLILYPIITSVLVVAFWPWLWSSPWVNFIQSFKNMAQFRWDPEFLFRGEIVKASNLPKTYIPVWLSITTPKFYLALFMVGMLVTFKNCFYKGWRIWRGSAELQDLIFLGFFIAPIISVISLNSILYNGWRHIYFIYPAFLMVALLGWFSLWEIKKYNYIIKISLSLITLISFSFTASWMIKNHPLQNLYFNSLAGNWTKKFEVDYWALAYKPALEKILSQDSKKTYLLYPGLGYQWPGGWQLPFTQNLLVLQPNERARIHFATTEESADYVITSDQARKNTAKYKHDINYALFHEIQVDNQTILSVFRKKVNPELPIPIVNQKINFGELQNGIYYLLGSWQTPETWGTWSNGDRSKLRFPLPPDTPKSLAINVRALIADKCPRQELEIWLNKKFLKKITLSKPEQLIYIEIPNGAAKNNYLDIEFRFFNATTPKSIGLNDDERILAIGLISAYFH